MEKDRVLPGALTDCKCHPFVHFSMHGASCTHRKPPIGGKIHIKFGLEGGKEKDCKCVCKFK